jgi:PGF-CTERM protein
MSWLQAVDHGTLMEISDHRILMKLTNHEPLIEQMYQKQPEHVTDPSAALMVIGEPPVASTAETTIATQGTQAAPGFGFAVTLFGLFACALLVRRHNK